MWAPKNLIVVLMPFLLGTAMVGLAQRPRRVRHRDLIKVELKPEDLFYPTNEFGEDEERALQEEDILDTLVRQGTTMSMTLSAFELQERAQNTTSSNTTNTTATDRTADESQGKDSDNPSPQVMISDIPDYETSDGMVVDHREIFD